MSQIVKIRKAGNSVIITITKDLMDRLDWKLGDLVEVSLKEDDDSKFLEIRKVKIVKA